MLDRVAKVVSDVALNREFDYRIPDELADRIVPGCRVRVPFGRRTLTGTVTGLATESEYAKLKDIISVVGKKALITPPVMRLARWMSDYYAAPLEKALQSVVPGAVRREGAHARELLTVRLTETGQEQEEARKLCQRAPRQLAVLELLWNEPAGLLSEVAKRAGADSSTVRALERKGLVTIGAEAHGRDPLAGQHILPTEPLPLMPQQSEALHAITQSMDATKPETILLYGVTGSGKTEVYLQAIDHALSKGQGAIVLVPEISLTPQMLERFCSRFGDRIAVLHSHLSDGERHDEWHRLRSGEARIAIGARSSLFAPVENLGLIVVDEEHEPSYKQSEEPRYHARDVAVMRGRLDTCTVVLGSATPAVESWNNARSGKYRLCKMPHRVDHRQMPHVRVIDMRIEAEKEGRMNILSRDLVEAITRRLNQAEQVILFLNRRGYSRSLICGSCGHVAQCDDCSVPLTYHRAAEQLHCHICGATRDVPQKCLNPDCALEGFRYQGFGTERVESALQKCFPQARVARMDSDTTTRKGSHARILGNFRGGKIDILVGTQMIAKGLHFPRVTLVGVISADTALHLPDFRAGERTFQLLTQVAGRAGRGDVAGEVLVQTYTPFHPAIQAARHLAYEDFTDQEIEFRRQLFYPPFSRLICLTFRGPDEKVTEEATQQFYRVLALQLPASVSSAEPGPAPLARAKGKYRFQILLRIPRNKSISKLLLNARMAFKWPADVHCSIDVDALSLM